MKNRILNPIYNRFNRATSFLLLGLFSVVGLYTQAQTYYNNNNASSTNVFPLGSTTNRVQWIYGPNLFKTNGATGTPSGGGTISKIYFRIGGTASATAVYSDFTISLAQNVGTTAAWSSTTWNTGMTTVYYRASHTMTGAAANSWYGVTLQTPFAYDPNKSLVFEMKLSAGTGNSVAQAGSTNQRIWGTYAGTSGTSYGSGLVDFGFDLMKGSNDAGISAITTPLCAPALNVTLANFGINSIDSVKLNWSVDGKLQSQNRYNTPLPSGQTTQIKLSPDFAFVDASNYTVKVWTSQPNGKNDTLNKNDTFSLAFKYLGPSKDPVVSDITKCGPGKVILSATPGSAADSVAWFDAASGGNMVASGKNALSPQLYYGTNTFYAQSSKITAPTSLANSMVPSVGYGSTYSGGFANITPNKGVLIDSICIVMTANIQNSTWNVYYRAGTYIGSETNAAAWTSLGTNIVARVRLVGSYYRAYIKLPGVQLSQGVTYGFYATSTPVTPCSPWTLGSITGGVTTVGPDLTVFQDRVSYGATQFTTPNVNYPLTWETFYRPSNCPSNRVPMKVTVKPAPNGAAFIKGTPFQTTQPNSSGSLASPDIVAKGDKLTYEITPPTGYNNSDYGTTWIMKGFTVRTPKGYNLPSSYLSTTSPMPSGSNNAVFTFSPDGAITDSLFLMTMTLQDLGPHFCDSTITRYIFVAPRPTADFKFPQPVCDGEDVIFTNTSKVSSGYILSKWDFGTGNPGDTATTSDVVFRFPTFGTYYVTLTTTTSPYGYTDKISIPIVVTEIPKIGFKVFNACLGDSVNFVNSTTISSGFISYKWDFGNGTFSTKVNPKQKYPTAGSYKVTLTATSNGCSQTMSKNAWEFARPVAKFTTPGTLCDKTEIQFVNGSTITTGNMGYRWTFSDGGISTLANPLHAFTQPGIKTVKMKVVSEFGCADSVTKSITLAEAPLADFTTGPVCNLSSTQFNFTGTRPSGGVVTSFLWTFGSEGISNLENPSKLLKSIGTVPVTLALTSSNGCTNSLTKDVVVKLQSKADFTATDVCDGDIAVFTNKSTVSAGNLSYNWKFGDGKSSVAQSPRHVFPAGSKTYNVTLVAIVPGGCSDSVTKAVSVNTTPVSDFTYTTSGRLVYFKASQSGNTEYHWSFGEGGTANGANAQYHYVYSPYGNYKVCLSTTNAADCFSQTCKQLVITGGVSDVKATSGIRIYPNPNKGNFEISVADPKSDLTISIYNLLGDKVKSIDAFPYKTTYTVDLNAAAGVYFVKVLNGGKLTTQKITVDK